MRTGEEVAAAARGCIGARFRPHGREPAYGLDCAGVAAVAFGVPVAARYAMRGGSAGQVEDTARAVGLVAVSADDARPGDLWLIEAGPEQLHLAVLTGHGFVHANARLRRVVETPGRPMWPVLGAWRAGE